MAASPSGQSLPRTRALKDKQLRYLACTLDYAQSLQFNSPQQLVGQTDLDVLTDRSAALVNAADKRVLQTGQPEVTPGDVVSVRTAGLFFVRNPVFNRSGSISGVEVFVVSTRELHNSFKLLLGRDLELRKGLDESPIGLLVLQNGTPVYANTQWRQSFGNGSTMPLAAEVKQVLPLDQNDVVRVPTFTPDGVAANLQIQKRPIKWHGQDAQLLYCVMIELDHMAETSQSGTSVDDRFIEKRQGHWRQDGESPDSLNTDIDRSWLSGVEQPMFILDQWLPIQVNAAARKLLGAPDEQIFQSVENWFSDRAKAKIGSLQQTGVNTDPFVTARLELSGVQYSACISRYEWRGRDLLFVSLQPRISDEAALEQKFTRYKDYVASAGDFCWEMDAELKLTVVSMQMRDLLGVDTKALLNQSIDGLISAHVHADDVPEWNVLVMDLNKHIPFRDREYKWIHRDGNRRVVRLSGVPVFDSDGSFAGYRGVGHDFTAQHNSASLVAYHASHDSLTGLVNRREFELRCDEIISRAPAQNQVLCFIDLDNFKRVNDNAGHPAGDELLRQLSALLTGLVRKSDVLARLGGDEFGLLIYDVGLDAAMRLATQVCAEVESYEFQWHNRRFTVGASIGLVVIDNRWQTRSALFAAADAACYDAKNKGKNQVSVYVERDESVEVGSQRLQLADVITTAIQERRIKIAIQKIRPTEAGSDTDHYLEVLLRIPGPDGDLLQPGVVLPIAERHGLSSRLDQAVVETTFSWLSAQPHVADKLALCCINLSVHSITDDTFADFVCGAIKTHAIDPSLICFEVGEAAISANLTLIAKFMQRLGDLGCQFAVDDFTGGLNSFNYLKKLPVSYVKISSSYITAILEDPVYYKMVNSINDVAITLGKKTIAESVESEAVLDKLREVGVGLVQGYHIAAPEIIDF